MKKTLGIIGVGLMGGSLGLAVRKRRLPWRVLGIGRNPERLKKAKRLGAADAVTVDLAEGARESDLLVICTPVDEIVPMFERILPLLKKGAVVTDIGSVKGTIVAGAQKILAGSGRPVEFVGSHPLAGSEKTGVAFALPGLYDKMSVVVCPLRGKSKGAAVVENLWRSVGGHTLRMAPEIHDILVAQTSHLPHLIACALARQIGTLAAHDANAPKLLAGSFRDMTRIADSDSRQWAEICRANQKFILGALKSYRDVLKSFESRVQKSSDPFAEWEKIFSGAKAARSSLLLKHPGLSGREK